MMTKIIAITKEVITIGYDDGSMKEVPAASVNFVPHVGDEVEVFESAERILLSKVEKAQPVPPAQQPAPNIIITNTNTNSNVNVNKNGNSIGGRGKPKNKIVAILLCLLLGVFGGHKFYEGKTGMGILYLFTGGLLLIGVIVDFIALLGKPNPYYVQ